MPDWRQEIITRLAGLRLSPTREAEIIEELRQHLDDQYNELLAGGAAPEEAYRAALAELNEGPLPARELMKKQPIVIETNSRNFSGNLRQDLRYSIRMLRKNPGFTAVTILILALGIGANTAIFSVVNAVLLRPSPYPESGRMMVLREGFPGWATSVSATKFLFWREHNRTFESMAATDIGGSYVNLAGSDKPESILNVHVSADFFKVHGISPALGRGFSSEEERPGGNPVVIVSEGLWKRRFGGDPGNIPRLSGVRLDGGGLVFTLAIALSTGILFGLAPAFQLARVDLSAVLNESSGRASVGIRRSRLRSLLVVIEIGLSSLLLVGAALLLQTFANLRGIDPGFDPRNVLNLKVSLPETEYKNTEQMSDFFARALERIESVPGVQSAAVVTRVPLGSNGLVLSFSVEGMKEDMKNVSAYWDMATPNYFRAMSIPLERGRYFTAGDSRSAPAVALISETLARKYFPNKDPIGQLLTIGKIEGPDFADSPRQIVGVVGDVRMWNLITDAPAAVYIPDTQAPDRVMRFLNRILPVNFVIRTGHDPLKLAAAVQHEILSADPRRAIFGVRSLEQVTADSISSQRFQMFLLGSFAAVALLLAAIGLYGVISYSVSQRTGEIGIRLALGAQPRDVLKLIVGQGLILTLLGLALGLAGALALTRLLAGLLYGVSATDPLTFTAIALLLAAVALLASYIPARRVMKVDPIMALRSE